MERERHYIYSCFDCICTVFVFVNFIFNIFVFDYIQLDIALLLANPLSPLLWCVFLLPTTLAVMVGPS